MFPRVSRCLAFVVWSLVSTAPGQAQSTNFAEVKRVTVSQNNDGSRTTYEIDGPNRKEIATTTGEDGKVKSKVRYDLDENGRFAKGEIYGPGDQLRFRTTYKYDASGRLAEEAQYTKEGVLRNRLVYSYDALSGRQTGYAIYDAAGKAVGQTQTSGAATSTQSPPQKKR